MKRKIDLLSLSKRELSKKESALIRGGDPIPGCGCCCKTNGLSTPKSGTGSLKRDHP